MFAARDFLPPPRNGDRGDQYDGRSFFTLNAIVDEEDSKAVVALLSAAGNTICLLIDSGSSVHMTP